MDEKLAVDQTSLNKSLVKGFACETDARFAIDRWISKHKRYLISELHVTAENRRSAGKRGRPKIGEILEKWHKVSCKISLNPEVVRKEQELMGRFILASNDTTIDPDTCLQYYKEQSTVERGFRFMKGNTFHASEVYLKNEDRIPLCP